MYNSVKIDSYIKTLTNKKPSYCRETARQLHVII